MLLPRRSSLPRVLVVLCMAWLLLHAPAAAEATTGTELGGMNLSGYCQKLEVGNKGATLNGETWVCIHADNTTSTLNLQDACEHEYTQRPVKAEEITPGVPFSWKCFLSSGEGGGSPKPGATPTGGGEGGETFADIVVVPTGPPSPQPPANDEPLEPQEQIRLEQRLLEIEQQILKEINEINRQVIQKTSLTMNVEVGAPGALELTVASTGVGAEGASAATAAKARAKATTVIRAIGSFTHAGRFKLRIPLTRAGKALISRLAAADRAYRRSHPHGRTPPRGHFNATVRYRTTSGRTLLPRKP